jgi:hypothetical protein
VASVARTVGRRVRIDSARLDTDRPSPCPGQTTGAVSNPLDFYSTSRLVLHGVRWPDRRAQPRPWRDPGPDYAVYGRYSPSKRLPQEALASFVERVTFHNEENGFCVLRTKARGHRDLVTVVGHSATIAAGEWITATGEWANDRNHGQQFRARFLRTNKRDRTCDAT